MSKLEKVNIRPTSSILSILKHLEYKTWFALAEYVDNSIQSFIDNEVRLKEIEGEDFQLEIEIEIDEESDKIIIKDNAAGINEKNFNRAFRPAEIPPDTSGLSEFGMGMKSASCWFSDVWEVRTKALGEEFEKTVKFDINKIYKDKLEELSVYKKKSEKNRHYTVIELSKVSKLPRKKNISKVKDHLSSIYRDFLRNGQLILKINSSSLTYKDPAILFAPKYNDHDGEAILWKREIDLPIEKNLGVKGFVGILEKGSLSNAGFALFRRGRVVEGSFDETFRPEFIFGKSNSYPYQRIFGELHLEGFNVNFTKKGIQWDNNFETFLQLLRDDINHRDFPMLKQAEHYRARLSNDEYKSTVKSLNNTVNDFEKKVPDAVKEILNKEQITNEEEPSLTITNKKYHKEFNVMFNKINWNINVELSYDSSLKNLYEIGDHLIVNKLENTKFKQIGIRLSLTHPFMNQFAGNDNNVIEPVLRIISAFALSEVVAKQSGSKLQSEIRRNFNDLIYNISTNK